MMTEHAFLGRDVSCQDAKPWREGPVFHEGRAAWSLLASRFLFQIHEKPESWSGLQ